MTITGIHTRRGQLYALELDGVAAGTVDRRTLDESPYRVGSSLTEEELAALQQASEERRQREKALYLLTRRDHSRTELARKLARTGDREVAERTAGHMEALGLVDDEAYAHRLAADLRLRRHFSQRRAEQELIARGIGRELAREAAAAVETDDAAEVLALLRGKYAHRLSTPEDCRRTAAALMRLGFGGGIIRAAMRELEADPPDIETDDLDG